MPANAGSGNRLTVHNPMGHPPKIEQLGMAPRPQSLDGRTVYLVDARFDDGDILMAQMQAWFREHLPRTKTVLARKSGVHTDHDPKLFAEIKEHGDAMVLGVGH